MTDQPIKRKPKKVIRRTDLSANKLSTTKAPPKPKPQKKPKAPYPQKSGTRPSDIRLDDLNASLCAFKVWREYKPLALGIEKQLFQHIAKNSLSSSKRVVQRLLREHTKNIIPKSELIDCSQFLMIQERQKPFNIVTFSPSHD